MATKTTTKNENSVIKITDFKYACVYGHRVYGIGETREEAMKNAVEYLRKAKLQGKKLYENFSLFLSIKPITVRAAKYIRTFGYSSEVRAVEIPLTTWSDGLPVQSFIDIVGNKARVLVKVLEQIEP